MSTRSVVKIVERYEGRKKPVVMNVYHHYDGYPDGVGKDLIKICEKNYKHSNGVFMFDSACTLANQLVKDKDDTGYEITQFFHVDIEYLYTVDINLGTITCQSVYCKNWDSPSHKYTIRKTIDLSEFYEENIEKVLA